MALIVPLSLHAWLLARAAFGPEGLYLGVGNAVSVIIWLTVLIYWAGRFFYRLEGLQVLVVPAAAALSLLPLALPALVVVTFFSFTHAWNEFLYAHVFTSTNSARTITTGLANFMSADVFFWGPLMASTVMSALPPVIMFLVLQRWVVQGLTLGGVKG